MALTLSQLQSLRDDLVTARLGGLRELRDQNGETVTFKSDAEMQRALAALDREIAALGKSPPTTILFKTSKGVER